jgi:outer membrane protein TolC
MRLWYFRKYRSGLTWLVVAFIVLWQNPIPGYAMAKMPPKPKPARIQSVQMTAPDAAPLNIRDCYRLALRQSETIGIKKEEIEKTKADFFQAASVALGDVDFVMSNTQQDKTDQQTVEAFSNFTATERRERKFVFKQPLFQGFKAFGAIFGAGSLMKQRKEEWVRAEQLLFLDVVEVFYNVMKFKKDVKKTEDILEGLRGRIKELKEREEIGRSRLSEVVTADASLKTGESGLAALRGALRTNEIYLAYLIGEPVKFERLREEELETDAPRTLEEYLALVDARPDVKAARQAEKVSWDGLVVAQSNFWPDISLENNNYEHREGTQNGVDWDVLFKINVPIFHGGENVGKMKKAVSEWKQAKLNYSRTRRQAILELEQTFSNWETARERHRALIAAEKSSEENYRLQSDEYSRSLVNNLDVLEALRSLLQSSIDANQAFYEMKTSYWHMKVAVGEVLPPVTGMADPIKPDTVVVKGKAS